MAMYGSSPAELQGLKAGPMRNEPLSRHFACLGLKKGKFLDRETSRAGQDYRMNTPSTFRSNCSGLAACRAAGSRASGQFW